MDREKFLLDAVTGSVLGVTAEYDSNGSLALRDISAEEREAVLASNTAEMQQLKTFSQVSPDYENAKGNILKYFKLDNVMHLVTKLEIICACSVN